MTVDSRIRDGHVMRWAALVPFTHAAFAAHKPNTMKSSFKNHSLGAHPSHHKTTKPVSDGSDGSRTPLDERDAAIIAEHGPLVDLSGKSPKLNSPV